MDRDLLCVGVYQPRDIPQSFKVYTSNILSCLSNLDITFIPFDGPASLPQSADVIWDVRSGGGNAPPDFLLNAAFPPLVLTVHGFAPTSLPGREYFDNWHDALMSPVYAWRKRKRWASARTHIHSVIAVSAFTKQETMAFSRIPDASISVCHHGVDAAVFKPGPVTNSVPYLFHISNDEPRKNVRRIVAAFNRIRDGRSIELLLKLPESSAHKYAGNEGVRVISGYVDDHTLSRLYSGALGFIFPSLYEGFGMPILEAMAAGCPVVTSNVSACPEVASGAALTVDPRNVDAIGQALHTLLCESHIRRRLVDDGLLRAREFTWRQSALCHARVFRKAATALL